MWCCCDPALLPCMPCIGQLHASAPRATWQKHGVRCWAVRRPPARRRQMPEGCRAPVSVSAVFCCCQDGQGYGLQLHACVTAPTNSVSHAHTHTHTYTHMHAHAHVHARTHTHTHTQVRTDTHTWRNTANASGAPLGGASAAGAAPPDACGLPGSVTSSPLAGGASDAAASVARFLEVACSRSPGASKGRKGQ